jgi:hypothetical protein
MLRLPDFLYRIHDWHPHHIHGFFFMDRVTIQPYPPEVAPLTGQEDMNFEVVWVHIKIVHGSYLWLWYQEVNPVPQKPALRLLLAQDNAPRRIERDGRLELVSHA